VPHGCAAAEACASGSKVPWLRFGYVCIGYKVEVPKKEDVRGWRKLRDRCRERAIAAVDATAVTRVRELHQIERRIAALAALPANKERTRLIADLRKQAPNKSREHNALTRE
jgi:hypothetical protein